MIEESSKMFEEHQQSKSYKITVVYHVMVRKYKYIAKLTKKNLNVERA